MDWMISQELKVRNLGTSLFYKYLTQIIKRLRRFFLKTFFNLLNCWSETQVVIRALELESNKILIEQTVICLEINSLMYIICQNDSEMLLNSLQKERNMNVSIAILEGVYSKMIFTIGINSSPQLNGRFWNTKENIQETYDSSLLDFLLSLFGDHSFCLNSNTALNIKFVVNFKWSS